MSVLRELWEGHATPVAQKSLIDFSEIGSEALSGAIIKEKIGSYYQLIL